MKILAAAALLGFVNTNSGRKVFVCSTPQPTDLDATAFAALTWVEVGSVGNFGETGDSTNILVYDTWNESVDQKAKGRTNAGDPELECAFEPSDAGQIILRAAALTNFYYAIKIEGNDKPNNDVDSKPTIRYNRGLVTGPRQPNGRNEDFVIDIFTLAMVQKQITVLPVDGTA